MTRRSYGGAMPGHILGPGEGRLADLGGLGARFMLDAVQTGGGFSLVEHPMAPRTLGSPIHTHSREDEYSYVLEGRIGLLIGEEVLEAPPGDLVLKPRGVPHAFWNATDAPARLLEIISSPWFERYFAESEALFGGGGPPDLGALAGLAERYGLAMDFASVPRLAGQYGLDLGPAPVAE
jgi:mannose-6-phosphate isomerase-like protein (cupin superfamily)